MDSPYLSHVNHRGYNPLTSRGMSHQVGWWLEDFEQNRHHPIVATQVLCPSPWRVDSHVVRLPLWSTAPTPAWIAKSLPGLCLARQKEKDVARGKPTDLRFMVFSCICSMYFHIYIWVIYEAILIYRVNLSVTIIVRVNPWIKPWQNQSRLYIPQFSHGVVAVQHDLRLRAAKPLPAGSRGSRRRTRSWLGGRFRSFMVDLVASRILQADTDITIRHHWPWVSIRF